MMQICAEILLDFEQKSYRNPEEMITFVHRFDSCFWPDLERSFVLIEVVIRKESGPDFSEISNRNLNDLEQKSVRNLIGIDQMWEISYICQILNGNVLALE